ncbi:PepSY domain-containing protein [Streptomyces albidoflavus]
MKRNAVIAALTAVAVIGGGAAAVAVSSGDDAPATASPADRVSLVSGQETAAPADRDDEQDDDRDAKGEDDRDDRRDDDKDDQDDRRDDKGASADPGNVTAAQAIAAALKHTSGTVLSADLDDDDDGDRRWEVEVATGGSTVHEIDVDSTTGKVVRTETDRDEDDAAAELKAVQGAKVSARDAAAAVDGAVTSVEFDDGRWEVEVGEADWTVPLDTPRASREG